MRLFADIIGRMLPRMQRLAIESTAGLLSLALAVTLSIPLFFLYLKAPEAWLNDGIVIGNPSLSILQLVHASGRMHAFIQGGESFIFHDSSSMLVRADGSRQNGLRTPLTTFSRPCLLQL